MGMMPHTVSRIKIAAINIGTQRIAASIIGEEGLPRLFMASWNYAKAHARFARIVRLTCSHMTAE
jgi:hypothetical protein